MLMATTKPALVGTHDGIEIYLTNGGLFKAFNPATQKPVHSSTLLGLKNALNKNKKMASVTLLGTRLPGELACVHQVVVTGVGKPGVGSNRTRKWDGYGEAELYALDPVLEAEISTMLDRHREERYALNQQHELEAEALRRRLIPLHEDEVKALLYGGGTQEQKDAQALAEADAFVAKIVHAGKTSSPLTLESTGQ